MKTQWSRVLGSLVVVTSLAACGNGGDSAEKPSSTSTSAPTSTAASSSSTASSSGPSSSTASSSATASHAPTSSTPRASASGSSHGSAPGGASVGTPTSSAVRIAIPSIGLDHSLTAGGLRGGVLDPSSGTIQQFVGYGRVSPGAPGISVLAGHVTYNGPDVFYRLSSAPVGGRVTISYADGTHKDFVITSKASVDKTALQNDARVWGSSATPVVALVTCDAASGWVNAHHHSNNFVVWARPA